MPPRGPSQGLVCRRRHDVHVGHRAGVDPGGNEAGDVGDVRHHDSAGFPPDPGEALEIDQARIGGGAAEQEFGPVALRQVGDFIVIEPAAPGVDPVRHRLVKPARDADLGPVRQVASVSQRHAHDLVPRFCEGDVDRLVGG